jgi:hypothetical protein
MVSRVMKKKKFLTQISLLMPLRLLQHTIKHFSAAIFGLNVLSMMRVKLDYRAEAELVKWTSSWLG